MTWLATGRPFAWKPPTEDASFVLSPQNSRAVWSLGPPLRHPAPHFTLAREIYANSRTDLSKAFAQLSRGTPELQNSRTQTPPAAAFAFSLRFPPRLWHLIELECARCVMSWWGKGLQWGPDTGMGLCTPAETGRTEAVCPGWGTGSLGRREEKEAQHVIETESQLEIPMTTRRKLKNKQATYSF